MAKKPDVKIGGQSSGQSAGSDQPMRLTHQAAQAQQTGPRRYSKALWQVLIIPSLLILGAAVALYFMRPLRDSFISGQTYNSYLIYGTYAAWSPKFWMIGLSSVLFAAMFIISIGKTIARREWGYWQRLIGLLALIGAGVLLLLIGLPEIGTDARDEGWTTLNGHYYHLLVQQQPSPPNTTLRFSIYDCDATAANCARVKVDDVEFRPGDYIPALDLLKITTDGPEVITQGNTSTEHYSLYRPQ